MFGVHCKKTSDDKLFKIETRNWWKNIKFVEIKIENMKVKEPLFEYVNKDTTHKVINGESLEILKDIEDGKFDLIITSTPYNVGKSYETKTSIEKYLESQEEIINELVRTLSVKGNLCWQVGNYVDKGEVFPLDIFYYQVI